MDGRRNDQGSPAPNADLYTLKLKPSYGYEWQMVDLDPSSNVPAALGPTRAVGLG